MSDGRPLSNAAGQYAFSSASESSNTSVPAYDFDAIPPRLHTLRQRLTDERFRAAFDFEIPRTPTQTPPAMPRSPSESQNRMRSVLRTLHEREGSPSSDLAIPSAPPSVGSMAPPARRQAQPSARFQMLTGQRARRLQRMEEAADNTFNLQEASQRLSRQNISLRQLLDEPLEDESEPSSRRSVPADDMIHTSESQHRRKRRRTKGPSRSKSPPVHPVAYGYHGQARPGPLNMDIRHSDGGDLPFSYDISNGWADLESLGVKNILKDDSSEYHSRHRRTNIVMQHPGERVFTLNRLVIKTPDTIEDDYVLQGLVFTSREIDATFDRTAHYQIHHLPASRFNAQQRVGPGGLRNYLRSTGRGQETPRHLPPLTDPDDIHHHHQISADCDAESVASDSDDSSDSRRPGNVVGERAPSYNSESDSDSGLASPDELAFPGVSPRPPAHRPEWSRSYMRRGLWHETGLEAPESEDLADSLNDDQEDYAAQVDFDEVLRRGAAASADRRRRRAVTRERVQRQRLQGRSAASDQPLTPPSDYSSTRANASVRLSDLHPRYLDAVEPPARPEDARWLDPPRTVYSDPPPAYPSHVQTHVDPSELHNQLGYKLLEPAAFFSTSRQARHRYSTRSRPSSDQGNPSNLSHAPEPCNPSAPSKPAKPTPAPPQQDPLVDPKDAVIVSYKPKKYGGRITIDFEAPMSTRYVMLKLWKSRRGRNPRREGDGADFVRLSRVRVEGLCGLRWTPAVETA